MSGGPYGLGRLGTFDGMVLAITLSSHTSLSDRPPPLFNKETDWYSYVWDSNHIAWMFEMSMDAFWALFLLPRPWIWPWENIWDRVAKALLVPLDY